MRASSAEFTDLRIGSCAGQLKAEAAKVVDAAITRESVVPLSIRGAVWRGGEYFSPGGVWKCIPNGGGLIPNMARDAVIAWVPVL